MDKKNDRDSKVAIYSGGRKNNQEGKVFDIKDMQYNERYLWNIQQGEKDLLWVTEWVIV